MTGSSKGRSVREEGHAQTEKNVAKDRKQYNLLTKQYKLDQIIFISLC